MIKEYLSLSLFDEENHEIIAVKSTDNKNIVAVQFESLKLQLSLNDLMQSLERIKQFQEKEVK